MAAAPPMHWQTTRFEIDLRRPCVMGIVNLTPDSFSDGGQYLSAPAALARCEQLIKDGAALLDLGAESSRPGALPVSEEEEWARLEATLRAALTLGVPVSVDTVKTGIMRRALDLGADIINDISALQAPGAVEVVAGSGCGVCLMHMQGQPRDMQVEPSYQDVVNEVGGWLSSRVMALKALGVSDSRIVLDPGYGFGKTATHNLSLLAHQASLLSLGYPLLVGWSRKSTLGTITGKAAPERLAASIAAALLAVQAGARVVRVHDVAATVDALKVLQAVQDHT